MTRTPTLVLHASEVRVEITCPEDAARALRAVWEPAQRAHVPTTMVTRWEATQTEAGWQIAIDGVATRTGRDDESLTVALEGEFVEHFHEWHPRACLLHAALVEVGVVWAVFVGESGAGKSSLTLAATRRGGRFFTDEVVVTDGVDVWGIGRSAVFDVCPVDSVLPARLAEADRESYRFGLSGQLVARPVIRVPAAQWAKRPVPAREVVVVRIRGQGVDQIDPLTGAEALGTLLEAKTTPDWRELGALASGRRAFALTWSDPELAIDALIHATSHLASDRRPSGL